MTNPLKSLRKIIFLLCIIVSVGVLGYMIFEEYSFVDALYMTIQTVSTVGFNEVVPFKSIGKEFTVFLIILSFGTFAFGISQLTQMLLNGNLKDYLKYRRVQYKIDELHNHVVICGYGRNGQQAAAKITAYKKPFVVIDDNLELLENARKEDPSLLYIHGDATLDSVLEAAGVARANALISALHNDSSNLFVVISARQLNPNLRIVSRSNEVSTEKKLRSAGANYTVSPNIVGGSHLAHNLMKPDVVEFLERIDVGGVSEANIEEVLVSELPDHKSNTRIRDLDIRQNTGCTIIGYKSPHGDFKINPSADLILESKSKLFVLGNEAQITKLRDFINE